MRPLLRVAIATALLTACTDIIAPPGVDPYEYRIFGHNEDGELVPLAFRWPREMLPIRLFVGDDDPLRPAMLRAIGIWENSLVFGEIRIELAATAAEADIVVRNERIPKLAMSRRLDAAADGCSGDTSFEADLDAGTLTTPFDIWIWSSSGEGPVVDACYEVVAVHELGHALGIFQHSPNGDDVMATIPTRNLLSERDRATIEVVYHWPVTLRPVR